MPSKRFKKDSLNKILDTLDEKLKPAVPIQRRGQLVGGLLAAARRITRRPKTPLA